MKTSKAIVFERPKKPGIQTIRLPEVDETTIVVKTRYSAISTGTEMKVYNGITCSLDGNLWYPLVPGYEEVGEVVYVGEKAPPTYTGEKLRVGDRVMANEVRRYPDHCAAWGGQVELAVKNGKTAGAPFDRCAKIPDGVSYQEAAVAYLACVAKKGMDKVGVRPGETVLVVGMGCIGLAAVQLARLAGAEKVIAMDVAESRLKNAARYTDCLINAKTANVLKVLAEMTDNKLADVIFEASGNSRVASQVHQYLKDGGWDRGDDGGRIHFQGDYPDPVVFSPYWKWYNKNMRISMTCAIGPGDKEAVLDLIAQKKLEVRSQITREVSVDEAPGAYEDLNNNREDILKILLRWQA
ncbi:MAG: zinc-binding dehydrogenase [Verrucomicrobiae bacterium]|nr:zinc-binding dehydrogenase [Verrucomicrobiae bacterium]